MGFPYIERRSQTFREPEVLRIFPLRSEEYASFSLGSLPLLTLWSYSSVSLAPKILKPISVLPCSHASYFIPFFSAYLSCLLTPVSTCCFYTDMGFNKDKKKKLADLLAKQRTAATRESLSTPLTPSSSGRLLPNPPIWPLSLLS